MGVLNMKQKKGSKLDKRKRSSYRKDIKNKKKRRDGEIGKHKLNEMGALNMKQKK